MLPLPRPVRSTLVLVSAALASPAPAGIDAAPAPAPREPGGGALIEGSLPNGFRHALLAHPNAADGISLRLIVRAGSLDERDDERGYAHFVEHMAFNGTRHYPAGKLVEFFQQLGMTFGGHTTAITSYTHTLYRIDLPASQAALLPAALRILRDFADGILFEPAEVRRERRVMLSELSARGDDDYQTALQLVTFYHEGSAIAVRPPGGDPAIVKRASAARLRAFYERCYRPSRMTLLAVGDLSPQAFAALTADNFETLAGRGADVAPAALSEPPPLGLRGRVLNRAKARAASVVVATHARRSADTPTEWDKTLAEVVVLAMLDRRLDECRAKNQEQFGFSNVGRSHAVDGAFDRQTLELHSRIGDWTAAVRALETELRRAREQGFSNSEIEEATAIIQTQLRTTRDEFDGETPTERGARVAASLVAHRRWRSPADVLAAAEDFIARFTPSLAAEALRRLFPEDRLHLVLTLPQGVPVAGSALVDAWRQSAAQPLAESSPAAQDVLVFKYTDFGPSGAVAEHRIEPEVAVHAVRFANGVRLSLRPSTSEPRMFRLTARLGSGLLDLPRDRPGLGLLAATLVGSSDLNRHTYEEFGRLIGLRGIEGGVHLGNGEFTESFSGPVESLPFALQCLTAFASDLKLDPSRHSQALSLYGSQHGSTFGASRSYMNAESVYQLAGADPRLQFPPRQVVEKYPFEQVAEWIRQHWLNGPLEIGLTGDFKVEDTIAIAAATVGTLPPRTVPPHVADATGLTLREKPLRKLSVQRLPDQAATVRVLWPAPAAADTRLYRTLWLAARVLEDRLRKVLREERGATYSPRVIVSRSVVAPAFATVIAEFTCPPKKAEAISKRIIGMADTLARKGISPGEFARLREPLIASATEALRKNEWWMEHVLPYAQSHPRVIAEARSLVATCIEISRDEANRAAADHLRSAKASVCGVVPGNPPSMKQKKR